MFLIAIAEISGYTFNHFVFPDLIDQLDLNIRFDFLVIDFKNIYLIGGCFVRT